MARTNPENDNPCRSTSTVTHQFIDTTTSTCTCNSSSWCGFLHICAWAHTSFFRLLKFRLNTEERKTRPRKNGGCSRVNTNVISACSTEPTMHSRDLGGQNDNLTFADRPLPGKNILRCLVDFILPCMQIRALPVNKDTLQSLLKCICKVLGHDYSRI